MRWCLHRPRQERCSRLQHARRPSPSTSTCCLLMLWLLLVCWWLDSRGRGYGWSVLGGGIEGVGDHEPNGWDSRRRERASTFAEADTRTSACGHGLQHAGGKRQRPRVRRGHEQKTRGGACPSQQCVSDYDRIPNVGRDALGPAGQLQFVMYSLCDVGHHCDRIASSAANVVPSVGATGFCRLRKAARPQLLRARSVAVRDLPDEQSIRQSRLNSPGSPCRSADQTVHRRPVGVLQQPIGLRFPPPRRPLQPWPRPSNEGKQALLR